MDIANASHIGEEDEVEVGVAIDGEVDATGLGTGDTTVEDRDDATAVDADLLESRLRHVKVGERRVAPAAGIVGECIVGGAEVGGGDNDGGACMAPLGISSGIAPELEASTASEAGIEEHGAKGGSVGSIARGVKVAVATGTTCKKGRNVRIVRKWHKVGVMIVRYW